jgi:acetyl-CoA carboxylase carboxyl transferase subunit alpha
LPSTFPDQTIFAILIQFSAAAHSAMKLTPLEFEKPILELQKQLDELRKHSAEQNINVDKEAAAIEAKLHTTREEVYKNLSSWERVQISRHTARPFALDYVERCFTDWVELTGDRHIGDDKAMPCGFATIGDQKCVLIGQQKGRDTESNILRNFGPSRRLSQGPKANAHGGQI